MFKRPQSYLVTALYSLNLILITITASLPSRLGSSRPMFVPDGLA